MDDLKKIIEGLNPNYVADNAKKSKELTQLIDKKYDRLQELADKAKTFQKTATEAIDELTKIKLESDMIFKEIASVAKDLDTLTAPF